MLPNKLYGGLVKFVCGLVVHKVFVNTDVNTIFPKFNFEISNLYLNHIMTKIMDVAFYIEMYFFFTYSKTNNQVEALTLY